MTDKEAMQEGIEIADRYAGIMCEMKDLYFPSIPPNAFAEILRANRVWLASQIMLALSGDVP